MTKSELRKIYLAERESFSGAEREEKSRRIAARFFERFDLTRVEFLHVFLPIEKKKEVETAFIFKRLWKDYPEIKTVAPRVVFETMTLENLRFSNETALVENRWRILEPMTGEPVESASLDVVLVPLLCFDERGFRVGYGRGFYDKFLSECRAGCLKIGLSFFPPIAEIADARDFDVRLDFCITPEKIFSRQQSAVGG